MTAVTSNIVFDDIFTINAIDKDSKKFDRVSRLFAHSTNYDMELTLDYNVELYPLKAGESFSLALASSLLRGDGSGVNGTDGTDEDKDAHAWRPDGKGRKGLEEDYDYVMYGRVYKFDSVSSTDIVTAYISYGGLLMTLSGSNRHLIGTVPGECIYLLMRK